MALAFLPAKHIPQAFEELRAQNRVLLLNLIHDVITNPWLQQSGDPIFNT